MWTLLKRITITNLLWATIAIALPDPMMIDARAFSLEQFLQQGGQIQTPKKVKRKRLHILPAKIIPSPQHYAQVHVSQLARLIIDPHHPMPLTGEKVEKGQVIAIVEKLLPKVDDTSKRAELYNAEAEISKTMKEINRLKTLGEYSAKKSLENLQIDLEKLYRQREAILTLLNQEFLRAPISGILNSAYILPGQVVGPESNIAEIIEPGYFWVRASHFSSNDFTNFTRVSVRNVSNPHHELDISLIGKSPLYDQSLGQIFLFKPITPDKNFIVGQTCDVLIEMPEEKDYFIVPITALVKQETGHYIRCLNETNQSNLIPIKVGYFTEHEVEIVEGLPINAKLLIPPPAK